jgi:asparagine synthase (glutamine-hydrolysing)
MCGLAGYLYLGGRHRAEHAVVDRMIATLAHRGPDSTGRLVENGLGIGFRRLAIVDLATGDQPIANEDGSVVLFCNGEIFNHAVLRAELVAGGHRFRTRSDVEVIVHLYEEHGTDLLSRLNGQFAFAIHDRRRERLVLARDQVALVPMFHTVAAGQLVFGSEIKALLRHPAVRREVDLRGLDQVVSLPGLVSPRTMFEGVCSLPAGHLMVTENGNTRIEKYWDLDYPPQQDTEDSADTAHISEHLHTLERALIDSVELRTRAEVGHGCYLSGGLDSSLVAALAAELGPDRPLPTFSAVLADAALSERDHQQLVTRTLGTTHTEVPVGPDTLLAGLRQAVYHSECPVKESYNVASLLLSAAMRERGLKFVLTGEGADELFGGYVGYKFDRTRTASRRPDRPLSTEDQLCASLWGNPDLRYGRSQADLEVGKRALYSPAVAARIGPLDYAEDLALDRGMLKDRHILHQRSYLDVKLRLPDHLLGDHGDRMALANSVEARYPFLDPAVIECARTMPPWLKLHGFEEKHAVKRIAARRLPASIVAREKFAFQANTSPDLLRAGAGWLDDLLAPRRLAREGFFDPGEVARLRAQSLAPDAELHLLAQDDLLMVVITFGILLDVFDLPHLG